VKRSILLADDSPTIQRLVKQTFVDADFEIYAVSNGDAAVKKLTESRPHLVLADVYMPGRNGYEVCAFVKNQPDLSGVPVVLLVGAFDAFDVDTATQAGAAAHITKPFEPQALVDLVNSLLSGEATSSSAPELAVQENGFQLPESADTEDKATDSIPMPESQTPDLYSKTAELESAVTVESADSSTDEDLLGLSDLFPTEAEGAEASDVALSDAQVDRIVDRVVKKLSTDMLQSVAREVVPDIAEKVVKDTLKKQA